MSCILPPRQGKRKAEGYIALILLHYTSWATPKSLCDLSGHVCTQGGDGRILQVPNVPLTWATQAKMPVFLALSHGFVRQGETDNHERE